MWISYFQEAFNFWYLVAVLYASGAMYQTMGGEGLLEQIGTRSMKVQESNSASSSLLSAAA